MRVPLKWLYEYVECDLGAAELAEKLTMAGIAAEEVEDLAAPVADIVIGRVKALRPHPGADRLLLAETDWGTGVRTLVTGAKNLQAGDLVPVAPVGASLPDGRRIEAAVFAGVTSAGMLCSAAELGLEKQSDGILVLTGDWPLGSPVAPAVGLDDQVLVLELTPNRADCLGLLGVAREVAALTGGHLRPPAPSPIQDGPESSSLAAAEVMDPGLCPRYAGKVLFDVRIGPSPAWMQHRLRAAGVRPINNLVDITNYVMIEMNQPLHAFDLDRLAGGRLIIRRAATGEVLRTLDGVDRVLDPEMLVIADAKGPVALAGVMGGAESEINGGTKRILLEGACFDRISVRRTARSLAMRTEASLRFERGVDGAAVVTVLERAAALAVEIGAARAARGVIDRSARDWSPRTIVTRPESLNSLLGTDLSAAAIEGYLGRLGFGIARGGGGELKVTVPTHRLDVEVPADLAEEVARMHGYDRIPSTYPASLQVGRRTSRQSLEERARRLMRELGQTETVTYSFTSPRLFDRLRWPERDPRREVLRIMAPLSEEWSVMRPTLLGGILEVLSLNARRGTHDVQIFEMARVYRPKPGEELPAEPLHLAGGLAGQAAPGHWSEKPRPLDFFDLKGLLEAFFHGLGIDPRYERGGDPTLHPGRNAVISGADGTVLGQCGEVHPRVAEAYDLRGPVFLYELDFTALSALAGGIQRIEAPARYPSIHRDLAVVVPEEVSLPTLRAGLMELGGDLLRNLELFDVYTGAQIGAGRRSLAFALTFRADDRTLTDAEVNGAMDRIVQGLKDRFNAALR